MRILTFENREVVAITEVSIKNYFLLKKLFDHAAINFDGNKEPEMVAASEYLNNELYPLLEEVERQYKHHFEAYENEFRARK